MSTPKLRFFFFVAITVLLLPSGNVSASIAGQPQPLSPEAAQKAADATFKAKQSTQALTGRYETATKMHGLATTLAFKNASKAQKISLLRAQLSKNLKITQQMIIRAIVITLATALLLFIVLQPEIFLEWIDLRLGSLPTEIRKVIGGIISGFPLVADWVQSKYGPFPGQPFNAKNIDLFDVFRTFASVVLVNTFFFLYLLYVFVPSDSTWKVVYLMTAVTSVLPAFIAFLSPVAYDPPVLVQIMATASLLVLYLYHKRQEIIDMLYFFIKGMYNNMVFEYLSQYLYIKYIMDTKLPEDYKAVFFSTLAELETSGFMAVKEESRKKLDNLILLGQIYIQLAHPRQRPLDSRTTHLKNSWSKEIIKILTIHLAAIAEGISCPPILIEGPPGVGKTHTFEVKMLQFKDTRGEGIKVLFLNFAGKTFDQLFGTPPDPQGNGGTLGYVLEQVLRFIRIHGRAPDIIVFDELTKTLSDPILGPPMSATFLKMLEREYVFFNSRYLGDLEITIPTLTVLIGNSDEQGGIPYKGALSDRVLIVEIKQGLTKEGKLELVHAKGGFIDQGCKHLRIDRSDLTDEEMDELNDTINLSIEKNKSIRQMKREVICSLIIARARIRKDSNSVWKKRSARVIRAI